MFKKATKAVKEVSETVIDSARSLGTSIYNASKEQGELAGLKIQKAASESTMQEFYAQIGKRYYDYINNSEGHEQFDVSEIVEQMQPELEKLRKINNLLLDKELKEKKLEEERIQKRAKETYEADKAQLDKALQMEIITQEEYDQKMALVQKKFDNHDQLRKIELQLQMGIIDREEYEEKVSAVLN